MLSIGVFGNYTLTELNSVVRYGKLLLSFNQIYIDSETAKENHLLSGDDTIFNRTRLCRNDFIQELSQSLYVYLSRLNVQIPFEQVIFHK